jgi:hypothetical protein
MKLGVQFGSVFIFMVILVFLSCSTEKPTENNLPSLTYNTNDYNIVDLEYTSRWYYWMYPLGLEPDFPHDDHGVILFLYNNQYYYHPFQIASKALWYLEGFRQTGDSAYLNLVNNYTNRLLIESSRLHDAIYVPYQFDYALHNGAVQDVMMAPWYSGFSQGHLLSLLSRTYELTGNENLKLKADSVFNSFLYADTNSDAWVVMVDSLGYYWIEEYPFLPQNHVLNGYFSGIYGLYDYYMITHDERCKKLIQGSATTIAHYFNQYRRPGGPVLYDLRYGVQDPSYHQLVITELRQLSVVTGDSLFSNFADSLAADYQP